MELWTLRNMTEKGMSHIPDEKPSLLLRNIVLHKEIDEDSLDKLKEDYVEFWFYTVADIGMSFPEQFVCECFFIHEFFDYISTNGDINMEDFEKVCSWVDSQQCPHAEKAKNGKHTLVRTSITAQHAAVASNNASLFNVFGRSMNDTLMCAITADITAVLKGCHSFIQYVIRNDMYLKTYAFLLFERRYVASKGTFALHCTDALGLCIRNDDLKMLRILLRSGRDFMDIRSALKYSMHLNRVHLAEELLESCINKGYYSNGVLSKPEFSRTCAFLKDVILDATLLDHPEMLRLLNKFGLLPHAQSSILDEIRPNLNIAFQLSQCLGHHGCTDFLRRFIDDDLVAPLQQNVFVLTLRLTQLRSDAVQCVRVIRKLHKCGFTINHGDTVAIVRLISSHIRDSHLSKHGLCSLSVPVRLTRPFLIYFLRVTALNVVEISEPEHGSGLISASVDILHVLLELNFPLGVKGFLRSLCDLPQIDGKRIIQVFLANNAICGQEMSACANAALQLDNIIRNRILNFRTRGAYYAMYVPPLSISNLVTPLLLDCGLPAPESIFTDQTMPEMLREHFEELQSNPRSLKMSCRTVLRRRFPRGQIHKYVEKMKCPKAIREYILLRHLVNSITSERMS